MTKKWLQRMTLVVLVGLIATVLLKHQAINDWLRLRGYTAPQAVSSLAVDDTMTQQARHLFYVNKPTITATDVFTKHCPAGTEKTVVLGCYVGDDNGIYIYHVSDVRLNGVEQVTAAHEMLHAAYLRLSSGERTTIDALLLNYFEHDLTDQRIKDTIAAYKKSEPKDVVNEMHSVFGTEAANLPPPLEDYYRQYFTDRAKIAAYTASYQAEFTSRQTQIASYDRQLGQYGDSLSSLKKQIDASNDELMQLQTSLSSQNQQLQNSRTAGDIAAYNSGTVGYNQTVDQYNKLVATTRELEKQYNELLATYKAAIAARNAIVLEEQQLTQELTAKPVTVK